MKKSVTGQTVNAQEIRDYFHEASLTSWVTSWRHESETAVTEGSMKSVRVKCEPQGACYRGQGIQQPGSLSTPICNPPLSHASSPPLLSSASHLKMKPDFNFADLALAFKWTLGVLCPDEQENSASWEFYYQHRKICKCYFSPVISPSI